MTLALIFGFFGAVLGHVIGDRRTAIAGALIGFCIGWLASRPRTDRGSTIPQYGPRAAAKVKGSGAAAPDSAQSIVDAAGLRERLAAIERRLDRLEQGQQSGREGIADEGTPEIRRADVAMVPLREGVDALRSHELAETAEPAHAVAVSQVAAAPPAVVAATTAAAMPPPGTPTQLWTWFTQGNTLTRIGVLALLFGVAFLLRWFAEHFTIPVAWRLLGVALGGLVLAALGERVSPTRPAYGRSLEGAGGGILYLTVFAAFRLYSVLPAPPAFALLIAISAATVWLALRADSQSLAALAIAGGFLAPVLVAPGGGEPVPLFGYVALLNGAVFAIAWARAWRALNALGFLFTFALALWWGYEYYAPPHFAVVEPFLALFFAFYVAIAVLETVRSGVALESPVDSLLVFGVPLTAFALQIGLVRDTEYGAAWSAVGLAAIYAVLFLALRHRREAGATLLAHAFLVLAIVFATLAVPFAVDARRTAAWWALEAAGAFWLGCRQRQIVVRLLALLLQIAAAAAFLWAGVDESARTLFANAYFIGALLIGLAAFATAFAADRDTEVLSARERGLLESIFAWGLLWWAGAGYVELTDQLPDRYQTHAVLGYVAASTLLALVLQRILHWPRLTNFGLVLLPAMALSAAQDIPRVHTTLRYAGLAVWPLAWLMHWATLRALDERIAQTDAGASGLWRERLHAVSAVLVVVWLSWEAGEWAGRVTAEGTAWITCATALPAIVYLLVVATRNQKRWPFSSHDEAYAVTAGTVVATLLVAWFVIANARSPGDPHPLPYVPIVNPLDLTLAAAVAACVLWARVHSRLDERRRYAILGLALFVALNGLVTRTAHHWADIPWRLASLLSYKPLQAALTLAWTATALPLMVWATRRGIRPLWMVGAALLALVVGKLFLLDLAALSGLPRVVAFLGVGLLLLLIGYLSPLPPAMRPERKSTQAP